MFLVNDFWVVYLSSNYCNIVFDRNSYAKANQCILMLLIIVLKILDFFKAIIFNNLKNAHQFFMLSLLPV